MDILKIKMDDNDAEAETLGEYLNSLFLQLWYEKEGFSGKRPFGNSGWELDIYRALGKAGLIVAEFDEYGDVIDIDDIKGDALIEQIINGLFK